MTTDQLLSLFRRDETWFQVRLWLKILLGIPFCFVSPLLLATMFWVASFPLGFFWPWSWWFLGLSLLSIPLLFHLEIRSGGNYLGEMVGSEGGIIEGSAAAVVMVWMRYSLGLPFMAAASDVSDSPRSGVAGVVEIFLQGPRYVLGGLQDRKSWRLFRQADRQRVADIIMMLRKNDRSMKITEILRPGENAEALTPTLFYLAVFDWVGLGQDQPKIWLLTKAKERLKGLTGS